MTHIPKRRRVHVYLLVESIYPEKVSTMIGKEAVMRLHQPFAPVAGTSVERYGPGEEALSLAPGDFILTHGSDWASNLIRFGQGLRFLGKDRKYTYWNHAAIIVDEHGGLIEALGNGVCKTNISKYKPVEYHLVRLGTTADATDREEAIKFAEWSLGEPYGWLTIVSIAIGLLTGGKFTFGYEGQAICSGLVARAMERTKAIFNRNPEDIMPADLAKYYKVEPPLAETPKDMLRRPDAA
jgi:hypothetical protein